MKIGQLRVQHTVNPLGMLMEKPVFSWVVEASAGKTQSAARIVTAKDEGMTEILHDTGWADLSSLGTEVELPLAPRTRYYWQVSVRADNGDEGTSDAAWFETGKRDEPWQAQWIAMPGDNVVHPVMKRAFTLDKEVQSARLYVCGLGLYEATINGAPVTDEHFAPFYDDYDQFVQYQTYDVTGLLHAGDNDLSAMLGGGWYMGRFGFESTCCCLYGNRMQLIAELHVTLADGTQTVIVTGDDWQCRPAPVLMSSIYDGESYDARLETSGDWQPVMLADAPKGKLIDRVSPRVAVTEELKPVQLLHTDEDDWVLDFGQVLTGWTAFTCDLPEGVQVQLAHGELLQNDRFYQENLRTAKAEFTFVSAGRVQRVRPHFTFYGFRYVKVVGLTEAQIHAADFTAQVIHSDLGVTGTLRTSDKKVNRLIANAKWSQRGNFLDIPTDCPQRDERMGWTGDAQVFCATASYNMYTPAFYRKYLLNMRSEQADHDGSVPHVVPDVLMARRRAEGWPIGPDDDHGSCAWADAATVIPWTQYLFYGDKALLREQYPGMKAWADWIRKQDVERCGGRYLWTCGFHFADWLALDNPDKGSCFGGTENACVASAYYYKSVSLTAQAAQVLGLADDAAYYADLAEKIRAAFQAEYFTSTGRCAIPTQTALALALQFDLVPDEYRARCVEMLKARLDSRGMHLDTGFVGTPLLCPALSRHGLHRDAVTLLLQEDYPSWLYEVNMGATTIWERWNSVMPNGLVSDTGMNSMNHYAYGSVLEWMYRDLAGLNPVWDAPGFKRVRIAPKPDERLDFVDCTYDSAAGRYEVAWKWEADGVHCRVTVPFDCEAEFVRPDGVTEILGAGTHEAVC